MTIYTLGPAGTYSDQAARSFFPEEKIIFKPTIFDVFEAATADPESQGLVPLENMIEGTVRETLDLLYETDLKIQDLVELTINHCLATKNGQFTEIVSHPQAIAQCRTFLRKNYPTHHINTINSTAQAAHMASMRDNLAAICSPFAARKYNLNILQSTISDYENNKTKFAVLGPKMHSDTYSSTSIAVTPIKDEPGLLVKILLPFHDNQVNLTKIESRPEKTELNQYIFFIDFAADHRQAKIRKIFDHLQKDLQICRIKVLGGMI